MEQIKRKLLIPVRTVYFQTKAQTLTASRNYNKWGKWVELIGKGEEDHMRELWQINLGHPSYMTRWGFIEIAVKWSYRSRKVVVLPEIYTMVEWFRLEVPIYLTRGSRVFARYRRAGGANKTVEICLDSSYHEYE